MTVLCYLWPPVRAQSCLLALTLTVPAYLHSLSQWNLEKNVDASYPSNIIPAACV